MVSNDHAADWSSDDGLLPAPTNVATALDGVLARHISPTLQATIAGYLIGSFAAFLLAAFKSTIR